MNVSVDVWLRGNDVATTEQIDAIVGSPREWTDDDVRVVLEGMLRAMDRRKRPGEADRDIALRGLSWIVDPYEHGGVLIAIEITIGAAVSGPFDIDQKALEMMIARVLSAAGGATTVH
jgi:alkylation response protein AidB-like acyl-CoA dehydrogenase